MNLNRDNSRDITCDRLFLSDTNNVLQNILTLISFAGSGITTLTSSGSAVVTGSGSPRNILVDLSGYTNTVNLTGNARCNFNSNLKCDLKDFVRGLYSFMT